MVLYPSQRISFLGSVIDSAEWGRWSHQNVHWPFSSSWLHSNLESLAPSMHFKGCWASWLQHLRKVSWACFTCGPFSTGWNLKFLHTLGITDTSVSRWARPALQLWPLGRTISRWNGTCPWAWSAEGRRSRQTEGAVRRKTGFRPLVENGRSPSHQLPGNAGSMFGPSHLSTRPEGTSRLSLLREYEGRVLHKSPGRFKKINF